MQPFDLLNHAAKAETPERLTDISSWHRHMPFAFALLDMLKPKVFVELGTHKGDSYSAFCQGIAHQELATRCFAVDTWQGDSQAGLYDDGIFADLAGHHDPRYSSFSTMLRMTFDEALQHFADGSVDLLHIDGLHTYEAVRHDFETWLPKMSPRGVVLFHDTSVRHGDFAVWRLWSELQQKYPAFEFPYGFGLGVLAVGSDVPEQMLQFIKTAQTEPQKIIQLFHALGDSIELLRTQRTLQHTQARLEQLGTDLSQARGIVESRDNLLAQYNLQRDSLLAQYNLQLTEDHIRQIAYAAELEKQHARHEHLHAAYVRTSAAHRLTQQRLQLICSSRFWQIRNTSMRLLGKSHQVLEMAPPSDTASAPDWPPSSKPKIDIIIPVYRGLEETRTCIESALASDFSADAEIIVINDASPEPELVDWLRTLEKRVTLLHNEQNLGFVGTVNRGMALHPERDVLLLNSDTEVAGDWLDRMQNAAYSEFRIGSVTPFSNSATICSYPQYCQENDLPTGTDVGALDAMFQRANSAQQVDIPTAVGFCMYIRRDCLDDCGLFDQELFGRGYGEENEFCIRSSARGWRHVLRGDVFVYHKGGVSFADTQSENQKAGHRALTSVYPNYDLIIREHIAADPAAHMRFAVDLLQARESTRPAILMINHRRGGGTEQHLLGLASELNDQAELYLLQPHEEGGRISLGPLNGGKRTRLLFEPGRDYPLLLSTLKALGISRIHFHHTIGVHLQFLLLPEQLGIPYDVTVHDYYLACPQITLTNEAGRYCGAPNADGCNACLTTRPAPGNVSIEHWREFGTRLLSGAERVFTPSIDTLRRMQGYFPAAHFIYTPHEHDLPQVVQVRPLTQERPLKVLVLGALSLFKGADLLEACALEARKQRVPIEFHLLGFAYRHLSCYPFSNLHTHGPYADDQVDALLEELQPDIVWFPGSCPETYSYTLSISLRAGLPVLASQIGAFPERLANRPWSWLIQPDQDAQTVVALLMDIRCQILSGQPPERLNIQLDAPNQHTYAKDYVINCEDAAALPEPDWEQLHAGWMTLNVTQQTLPAVRFPRAVQALRRALGWRYAHVLARRIPLSWKAKIKRVLWHA